MTMKMGRCMLLLAISVCLGLTKGSAEECCQHKVVDNEEYMLVESDPAKTDAFECDSPCIYEKTSMPGSRICFKAGGKSTQCMADCTCGVSLKDQESRIINGQPANVTDFPWYLGLIWINRITGKIGGFCGASLISRKWALTAAHCVTVNVFSVYQTCNITLPFVMASPSDIRVLLELSNIATPKAEVGVDLIAVPDNYVAVGAGNDIALLRLQEEVNVQEFPTICLPGNPANFVDEDGIIIGYGQTESGEMAEFLMKGNVNIVEDQMCNDILEFSIVPVDGICAGGVSSTCFGDSGGALMTKIKGTNKYELRGVTSFGNMTCGDYAVYANVSYHLTWIQDTMSRYGGMGAACV